MSQTKIRRILIACTCLLVQCVVVMAGELNDYNPYDISIPDDSTSVNSDLLLSGAPSGAKITSVKVYYEIKHARPSDLDVWLTCWDDGWQGDYFLHRVGESSGVDRIVVDNIHQWDGKNPNVTWYLVARDKVTGTTGYIDFFELWVTYEENVAPNLPSNPNPSNGATDVSRTTNLSWSCSDTNGDTVYYTVYFEKGDSSPDKTIKDDSTGRTADPGTLDYDSDYYWRVKADDHQGGVSWGPSSGSWHFHTEPEPVINAEITNVSFSNNQVKRGEDTITATVLIRNIGNQNWTFYIGASTIRQDDTTWYDWSPSRVSKTLSPGQSDSVSLSWSPSNSVPIGMFGFYSKIFKESSGDEYVDENWLDGAFTVINQSLSLSGRIAFHSYSSYDAMDSVISIYDLEQQNTSQPTIIANQTLNAMNAHFSPDGSKLVFMADPPNSPSAWWYMEIYLYDLADQSLVQLTDNGFPSEDPKFSPDGSKIVFKRYNSSSGHSTIYTMNLDGSNTTPLTATGSITYDESGAFYSSDGSKISFWKTWNDGNKEERIWWMNADGTNQEQLVPDSNVRIMYYPIFLDEQRLAYTRWHTNTDQLDQIYIYNTATHLSDPGPVPFRDESANDSDSFPITGDLVGFSSTRNTSGTKGGYDLYVGDLQNDQPWQLTSANTNLNDLGGSYSPFRYPRKLVVLYPNDGADITEASSCLIKVRAYSGGGVWSNANPSVTFTGPTIQTYTGLNDNGTNGDQVAGDGIYSQTVTLPSLSGTYSVVAEAVSLDNDLENSIVTSGINITLEPPKTILTNTTNVSVPEGGTSNFSVKLNAQPASAVTVSVSRTSGDTSISVQTATLSFDSTNWNTYQSVTLSAAEDGDAIDGTAIIRCSASGWTSQDVTATENDNDREFVTNISTVSVNEGNAATFQVKLKAQPSSSVQVSVSRVSGDSDISLNSGSSLTFTTSNWDAYQVVTLAAADDADAKDGVATIRCSATDWASKDIAASEEDNDKEFVASVDAVTVPEKGTATFQIKLKGEPSGSVVTDISRVSGDSDITIQSGTSLTFNSSNWDTYQTVTLAAAEDTDAVNGTATIRCTATEWTSKYITATEDDAQGSFTITSPSGGVKWEQGTMQDITWTSSGNPGSEVKLEYSTNNGAAWTQIIGSTDNDGAYSWSVPDSASIQCLIQITSVSKTDITGVSNAVFTIIGKTHHLTFGVQPTDSIATEGTTPVISPSPTISICDTVGTTVTSNSANVTISLLGGGGSSASLLGTMTQAAVSGVATFNDLRVTRAGESFQLQATSDGLTSIDSSAFDVTAQPALTIILTDSVDPVDSGDQVTYTVTYGNTGLAPASDVSIVEVLPEELSFVSATAGASYNADAGTIIWDIGTVSIQTTGQTVTFIAKVKDSLAEGGSITHSQLTIDCAETDPVTAATETTMVNDTQAPQLGSLQPVAGAEWVACSSLIRIHITDGGSGVDYDHSTTPLTVHVEGDLIYDGANETSTGQYDTTNANQTVKGICKRTGTVDNTCLSFTPSTSFNFEQQVDVTVTASDVSGNNETYSYHFTTELRSFGANAKVNSDSGSLDQDHPSTAMDSAGNIWVVWDQQTGVAGDSDIYVSKLANGDSAFGSSMAVFSGSDAQSHPVIAIDSSDGLYVTWQGNDPNGFWDVLISTSSDGSTWSGPVKVNSDEVKNTGNQQSPTMGIDPLSGTLYVAYQDGRSGNQDIWLATSSDGLSWSPSQITTNSSDQTNPVISVDPNDGQVYLSWTDARNVGSSGLDLYGTDSRDWSSMEGIVVASGDQSNPAQAAYGDTAHLIWKSETGLYSDVLYDIIQDGIAPALVGDGITDEANTTVDDPSIALCHTNSKTQIFATWTDGRSISSNQDTDIYFAETGSSFGTNILVNDDSGTAAQSSPELGVDGDGHPYIVWVDERNGNKDIYYAGAMSLSDSLPTQIISANNRIRVEATNREHLSVEMSSDALPDGVTAEDITIREVANPPEMPGATGNQVGLTYEYGPSGLEFDEPVTLRIPLEGSATFSIYRVYRYDPNDLSSLYYPWTDEGILNPATPSSDGTYLEVQVEHFSIYGSTGLTTTPGGGGGGGKGGCALTPYPYSGDGGCGPLEFFLPLGACVLAMVGLRVLENRRKRTS